MIDLKLGRIQVQSAHMLQAALSSFTQLKTLKLEDLPFPMSLDLTSCQDLKTLYLSKIHITTINISTVSLKKLTSYRVTGSLFGLLSSLPMCTNLTDKSITSLSNKQDTKILIDVLPRLTQTRKMDISMCHAHVAKAATRLTGLESLRITNIDMGHLFLILTPLMKHMKYLELDSIKMPTSGWLEFITSLIRIQHGFDILLEHTNIDDESVSVIHSCSTFKVTEVERWETEGLYSYFYFSRLS